MRRAAAAFATAALLGAACGSEAPAASGDRPGDLPRPRPSIEQDYNPTIDPANFVAEIDNPYMPLVPGTVYTYKGTSDGQRERNVVEVTNKAKMVMGVRCIVVLDQVWFDGELHERTLDWYAQDSEGNVWYFGEASADYKNGKMVSTDGSWEAGVDGALPGIVMLADPMEGDSYRQEYYEGEAEDLAKVISTSETATVPFDSFSNVLVTEDWNPLEPEAPAEYKFYAPGIGLIMEQSVKDASSVNELVAIERP